MDRRPPKTIPMNRFTRQTRDRTERCALSDGELKLLDVGKESRTCQPGKVPMTRRNLAAMHGIQPEPISRIVHAFQEEDIARFSKRHVDVPHIDNLLNELDSS